MNRQTTLRLIGTAVFAIATSVALRAYAAAGCASCGIQDLYQSNTGWVWIGTGVNMGSSCSSGSNRNYMAIDPTTDVGKAAVVLAETAMLTGRIVDLAGTGSCTGTGGAEKLSTIWVRP